MAEVFFDNPPVLQGKEADQLRQLARYLNTMSEKLNQALMTITIEQMAPEVQQAVTGAAEATQQRYDGLKSLIIKTAEVVRHEMDEITARLEDNYEALSSEFGTYERNLSSTITATAEGILQDYQFEERIAGLEGGAEDTDGFMRRINQYIFTGLVDEVNGKYGIAIGENVTGYDANNNPYLNTNRKTATFTMDELAFWQGETKLAYFSDRVFHIENGEVTKTMKMGNHTWTILTDGSMGLISG